MSNRSAELILELQRILPAPRSVVYRTFSDSEELATWWGPEGFTIPSLQFEPRVGEGFRIEMQPPAGDSFLLTGVFREVQPPARLAYSFIWEPPAPDDVETLVQLSFRDLGQATKVILNQGAFNTEERLQLHRDGWVDSFNKIERSLPQP